MSKIEDITNELEAYIANCKSPAMRPGKIICDREEIEELLDDLKRSAPEEIKQVRKIVANKEAIMEDAKKKAEMIVDDAAKQTNQLLSEHEIMREAYAQADEVVAAATSQAQQILDNATMEANQVRDAAMAYTDRMMADIENILSAAMDANTDRFQGLQSSLEHFYTIVKSNRDELHGQQNPAPGENGDFPPEDGDGINLDMI